MYATNTIRRRTPVVLTCHATGNRREKERKLRIGSENTHCFYIKMQIHTPRTSLTRMWFTHRNNNHYIPMPAHLDTRVTSHVELKWFCNQSIIFARTKNKLNFRLLFSIAHKLRVKLNNLIIYVVLISQNKLDLNINTVIHFILRYHRNH